MASVGVFNDMMEQFIDELTQTFPEEKSIKKYQTAFNMLRKANPRQCVDSFMKEISPYANQIMQKDESFILGMENEFLNELNIKKHWTPELSENTKNAIWQYLQTLHILGMTITTIPAEMLSMVEGAAAKCSESMQSGSGVDLMSSMSGILGSLLGGGGGSSQLKLEKN